MKQLLLGLVAIFAFGTVFAQSPAAEPEAQPQVSVQDATAPVEGEFAPVAQQAPAAVPPGVPVAKVSPTVSSGVIAASVGGIALVALAVGGGSSSSSKKPDRPSSP